MEPDVVIDWEALYRQVVSECEQLRLANLKLRYHPGWADRFTKEQARAMLRDPVKVYILAMLLIFIVLPLCKGLFSLLRRRYER